VLRGTNVRVRIRAIVIRKLQTNAVKIFHCGSFVLKLLEGRQASQEKEKSILWLDRTKIGTDSLVPGE
jgi:hypothetical protein